jgi:hypothetical protein
LALRQTLETFGSTLKTVVLAIATIGLGVLIHWYERGWPEASDEIATLIMTSVAPALVLVVAVFLWCFFWYSPYTQLAQLSERISFGIIISQARGHGDNLQSTYRSRDLIFVLLRDLTIVNRSENDDVVSLKLWLPLNNSGVVFSPQTDPPPNISHGSVLSASENIPSRRAVSGSLFFRIQRTTVPDIAAPFLIIIVTSQLTGVERAINSLDFAEVKKPYPRTLEELNQQRASTT